jgi:hypothetical protein
MSTGHTDASLQLIVRYTKHHFKASRRDLRQPACSEPPVVPEVWINAAGRPPQWRANLNMPLLSRKPHRQTSHPDATLTSRSFQSCERCLLAASLPAGASPSPTLNASCIRGSISIWRFAVARAGFVVFKRFIGLKLGTSCHLAMTNNGGF